MDTNAYLDMFLDESREHLQNLNSHMLELEKKPEDIQLVGEIFRSAHTLKGMAGSMGYEKMADLTHKFENVLDDIRNGQLTAAEQVIDLFFETVDHLEEMVECVAAGDSDAGVNADETILALKRVNEGETGAATVVGESQETAPQWDEFQQTVITQSLEQGYNVYHIDVTFREDCLLKAVRAFMVFEVLEKSGEVIQTTPASDQIEDGEFDTSFQVTLVSTESSETIKNKILMVSEIDKVDMLSINANTVKANANEEDHPSVKETGKADHQGTKAAESNDKSSSRKQKQTSIRVSIEKLDQLMNMFEELIIDKARLERISDEVNHPELTETVANFSRISSHLQDTVLTLRMVPVEQVFNRFPRMVRTTAKELNKKINLEISGSETELDRTVIDEIGDPLVHLIRNSVDHGIEEPKVRTQKGKSAEGSIHLSAYHAGNQVYIEIADDGGGIDSDKVLNKAMENGLIDSEEASRLPKRDIFSLMFQPGFSTADQVTDLSGRGVGLDVVRSKIESLGGRVEVDSLAGQGTTFTIRLPLTLSIIQALLVEVGTETYALPLSSIVEISVVNNDKLLSAQKLEMVEFRDHIIPVQRLNKLLKTSGQASSNGFTPLVIVKKGEQLTALAIDQFIGQQEIVIKSLSHYLGDIPSISGATILDNGDVALILDTNALVVSKEGGH